MRLTFIFIYLGFMVSAKRRELTTDESTSDESFEDGWPIVDGYLNVRGGVRAQFALEAALEDHTSNMICSPLSVLMPLGKLALGAQKRTKRELLNALNLRRRNAIKPGFIQLITSLEYLPGVTLDMANRIYVSTEKRINKKFAYNSVLIFKSSCGKIQASQPKRSADTINRWVAAKTGNKINDLIRPRDITKDTSMIIVNVIYFSGKWLNRFSKAYFDDFFSPAGRQRIPMMSRSGSYNYWKCDTLNAQIIEIPYEGSHATMIVALPYNTNDLKRLLQSLKKEPGLINNALKKMKITDITLTIPKFKIESTMDLEDLFKKIGLKTIFDSKRSGLTKIINGQDVFVSKSIHKAIIEVTELGTEAAAATAIGMVATSTGIKRPSVIVNRPFLFYITAYQEQLFAGIFNGNKLSK